MSHVLSILMTVYDNTEIWLSVFIAYHYCALYKNIYTMKAGPH